MFDPVYYNAPYSNSTLSASAVIIIDSLLVGAGKTVVAVRGRRGRQNDMVKFASTAELVGCLSYVGGLVRQGTRERHPGREMKRIGRMPVMA